MSASAASKRDRHFLQTDVRTWRPPMARTPRT